MKIAGREPPTLHPQDALARGIAVGDVVRVFNDRGAFLAGTVLSDGIRPGAALIATGAWFDPLGGLDKHGNPNAMTPDIGASRLGQGCSAQSTLVQIERFAGVPPPVTAYQPTDLVPLDRDPPSDVAASYWSKQIGSVNESEAPPRPAGGGGKGLAR